MLASANNVLCTVGKLDSAVCYLLMTTSQMLDVRIFKVDMVLTQCLIHLPYGMNMLYSANQYTAWIEVQDQIAENV